MFTETLKIPISGDPSLTWVSGSAPASKDIILGFRPKKIFVYGYSSLSGSTWANGINIGVYDEDISTSQYLNKRVSINSMTDMGSSAWFENVNDTGFSIGSTWWSYLTNSSIRWWAAY